MRICDLIKDQETYQAEMGQTVLETVRAMVERNIGAVPVVHNGRLVGIFSERDLMKRVVAEGYDPRSTCLAEVMTDDPLTINMNEEIDNCMALMRAQLPASARLPRRTIGRHRLAARHSAARFERKR